MKVPFSLHLRTQLMQAFKGVYKSLGDVESWLLKDELDPINIHSPIYISSLARSGTTIITELLSQLDHVCSHTYGDFPGVFTPYWNNWLRQKKSFLHESKSERAHLDRILINNNSPDAFEEILWIYFFSQLHKNTTSGIKFSENKKFVSYYCQHIKKHLLVKNKSRYIAKANYNINRIDEILKIFPDAKFIVPIRHPVNHIASLMKQHKIYLEAAKNNPKIDTQLAASGHFEFGNLREVIQIGHNNYETKVSELWSNQQELAGWATYWQGFYQAVIELQKKHPLAVKAIKFEDLCGNSEAIISDIFEYCHFTNNNTTEIKQKYTQRLSFPKYYKIPFNADEINQIFTVTKTVAEKFGYNAENVN
jgi:hypothetical protein